MIKNDNENEIDKTTVDYSNDEADENAEIVKGVLKMSVRLLVLTSVIQPAMMKVFILQMIWMA